MLFVENIVFVCIVWNKVNTHITNFYFYFLKSFNIVHTFIKIKLKNQSNSNKINKFSYTLEADPPHRNCPTRQNLPISTSLQSDYQNYGNLGTPFQKVPAHPVSVCHPVYIAITFTSCNLVNSIKINNKTKKTFEEINIINFLKTNT